MVHEVAHWLIAPDDRRCYLILPGAGPETGRIEKRMLPDVDNAVKEEEELLASLLGILSRQSSASLPSTRLLNRIGWKLERKAAEQFSVATDATGKKPDDGTGMPFCFKKATRRSLKFNQESASKGGNLSIADAGPSLGK